jgi:DNA-3-methyladenine glycosylase I
MTHLIAHSDGCQRCWWAGTDPLYVAYHDTEWGVPEWDDRALFEKLLLDGFQAGLSWITILRKRAAFRAAFDGFDAEVMVRYGPEKLAALMNDAGIVRNRAKIEGVVASARAYLALQETGGFARYVWGFVDGKPVQTHARTRADIATETAASRALSKDLRSRGFSFCGPTIVHAFMQAAGLVNDHFVDCHRHRDVARLGEAR